MTTSEKMDRRDSPLAWVLDAECFPDDTPATAAPLSWVFVDAGHTISPEAYEMCARCPVRLECLRWSYDQNIKFGFFGGVSPTVRSRHSYHTLAEAITQDRMDRSGRVETDPDTGTDTDNEGETE